MPEPINHSAEAHLVQALHNIADQAERIVAFVARDAPAFQRSDSDLASRVGNVSAEHVAMVRRSLVEQGYAEQRGFTNLLKAPTKTLERLSACLAGVRAYLDLHKDADQVRLVITEPGEKSALREAISRRHAIPPQVYQTTDAFINLARGASRELIVMVPFLDDQGVSFLLSLYSLCADGVKRSLICRPLSEPECGLAFNKRANEFKKLKIAIYEYALPSALPSGRETFHAKVIVADDRAYYVGSSNFMASALGRSLECGVIVNGQSARQLFNVVDALRSVAKRL
jgi:phosphatidylserine/phosphatidylglycerophosphate/cardiolipin synthase-like enzyme